MLNRQEILKEYQERYLDGECAKCSGFISMVNELLDRMADSILEDIKEVKEKV